MTAETLRGRIVLLVVGGIIGLTALLYLLVGVLLVLHVLDTGTVTSGAVPGELWVAAAALTGSLTTLLANSKMGGETSAPTPVTTAPGESLAVHEAPESPPVQDPNAKPWQLDDKTEEIPVVRSRRAARAEHARNQGDY